MNFLSHYNLDRRNGLPYYNLGLVLPDLMTIYKRKWKFNLSVEEKKILRFKNKEHKQIFDGCICHQKVDAVFHVSDFFKSETQFIKSELIKNGFLSPPFRLFFLAHILLELMMDRIIIQNNVSIADDFYDDLNAVSHTTLADFYSAIGLKYESGFSDFFTRFIESEYLYQYIDDASMLYAINRIMSRARLKQIKESSGKNFYKVLRATEKRLVLQADSFPGYNTSLL